MREAPLNRQVRRMQRQAGVGRGRGGGRCRGGGGRSLRDCARLCLRCYEASGQLQGLFEIKDTHRPWGGPMLLDIGLL